MKLHPVPEGCLDLAEQVWVSLQRELLLRRAGPEAERPITGRQTGSMSGSSIMKCFTFALYLKESP